MPKPTFLNLPPDKRRRFVDAALNEFALHDYRAASVGRIVDAAGIAKGSVYQYFDGKLDLYRYLVDLAAETKFRFIDAARAGDAADFFSQVRQAAFHGARFDFSQPRYASLLYHATYEPSTPETLEVSSRLRAASHAYLRGLVDAGLARGDLRPDLDRDMTVYVLYQQIVALRDFLTARFGFSFKDAVRAGAGLPIRDEELGAVLDELVGILRRGLELG
ncbi:MAG: TetR/AcrR family transcriptional regulator [Trueperaceae bacterium]